MPRFDTRLALMRAAEQLFAQHGVDRVSLREIAIAAGQRNVSAATYHFGSKRELIEAILERHTLPIQETWRPALLLSPPLELEALVNLLIEPIVAKVDDTDGGRCYLELCGELICSRSFPLMGMRFASNPIALEIYRRLAALGPPVPPIIQTIRSTRLTGMVYGSIGDYLRLTANGVEVERASFVSDLVNVVVAAIRAEPPRS